jgi:hypothetical protein
VRSLKREDLDKVSVGDSVLIPNGAGKPLSGKVESIDSNNVAVIRLDNFVVAEAKCDIEVLRLQ